MPAASTPSAYKKIYTSINRAFIDVSKFARRHIFIAFHLSESSSRMSPKSFCGSAELPNACHKMAFTTTAAASILHIPPNAAMARASFVHSRSLVHSILQGLQECGSARAEISPQSLKSFYDSRSACRKSIVCQKLPSMIRSQPVRPPWQNPSCIYPGFPIVSGRFFGSPVAPAQIPESSLMVFPRDAYFAKLHAQKCIPPKCQFALRLFLIIFRKLSRENPCLQSCSQLHL